MKKQLAILSLSALTVFSCGGNRTQAQSVEAKTDLKEMWEKIQEFCSEEDYGDYCFDCWQVVYNDNAEVPNIERLTYKGATVSDIYFYSVGDCFRIYFCECGDNGCSLDVFIYRDGKITLGDLETSLTSIEEGEEIRLYANEIRVFKQAGGFEEFKWDGEKFVKK